jgi:hypothetical protein
MNLTGTSVSPAQAHIDAPAVLTRAIRYSIIFFFFAALHSVVLSARLDPEHISEPADDFLLFIAQDQIIAPIFAGSLFILLFLQKAHPFASKWPMVHSVQLTRWTVPLICLTALLLSWAAATFIHHSFDMSLDEYMSWFQARIFLQGKLLAELSPGDFESSRFLQPFFAYRDEHHHLWASQYRPVFAAFRALFDYFAAGSLLNPALAVLSVWAIVDISKRLFPDVSEAPLLAAVLLLVSPQFLMTAASGFAFTAHLALNLLWLALFLRGSLRAHWLAAAVGVLAIGLHQVHFHVLFAAPFLLALLAGKLGSRTGIIPYMVCYSLALPLWVVWPEISVWLQTGDASVLPRSLADVDYLRNYLHYRSANAADLSGNAVVHTLTNVFRYFLWLSPVILPLSIVAMIKHRSIGLVPLLCGLSFLLTAVATHVLMSNQMHAWGTRYYHPVLGCTLLLAVAGYCALKRSEQGQSLLRGVWALAIASAVVLLPWRAVQVDAKVGPRATVQRAIEAIDADYVLIDPYLWFGSDYVRNDPFLTNRPRIVFSTVLPAGLAPTEKVVVLGEDDLIKMGLPTGTLLERGRSSP